MNRCKACLIPSTVPGVEFDDRGICNLCRSGVVGPGPEAEAKRQAYEADLEQAIESARGHGGQYDAVVCLSGGKDSLYLLHRAKVDCGLRVLAFTTDINIPDVAWVSIRKSVERLQVDHLVYRPPSEFYRRLFRYLLMNQEARGAVYTVSYVYAPLFEGDALRVALEKGAPLVLAGYSPGQPEPERMEYEFSRDLVCRTDWAPPGLRAAGVLTEEELGRFWNPLAYPAGTSFPRYLAPFHAWQYDQEEIMRRVVELGLAKSRTHASPVHSNYPINWLLMYSDLRNFGYNPYAPEFSTLIREGKASLAHWRIMAPFVDFMIRNKLLLGRNVSKYLRWLDIAPEDLRITRPRGAYDPVVTPSPASGT